MPCPFSADRAAEVFRGVQGFVPGDGNRSRRLPRFGLPAERYDGMGAAIGDGIVALARPVGSASGDRADLDGIGDLTEQLGLHGHIAHAAPSDFDGPAFQRLFVDTDEELAPKTAFLATMFASVPLAFALRLDPGAVDQQVQRPM